MGHVKTGGHGLLFACGVASGLLARAMSGRGCPDTSYSKIKCQNKIVTNVNYNVLHKNEVYYYRLVEDNNKRSIKSRTLSISFLDSTVTRGKKHGEHT